MTNTAPLELNGLDGANPLGFLAALGTLALCDRLNLEPRMGWRPYANSYRPLLWVNDGASLEEQLHEALTNDFVDQTPSWCTHDVIKRPRAEFRELATTLAKQATSQRRYEADLVAGFASDAVTQDKTDSVSPTPFSFANGQSGKLLMRDYRELVEGLTPGHLTEVIYEPWQNRDACKTFRWEPTDLRLYALRAEDPGSSTVYTTYGANVLGLWGLSMLPSYPVPGNKLMTAGMSRLRVESTTHQYWTWPIWSSGDVTWDGSILTIDSTKSLLSHPALQQIDIDASQMAAMGVLAVLRSMRVTYQKSLYFSPASRV